jgi:ribosomal protein L37AE/L43A
MLSEQEYKTKVCCPECHESMYSLKGSLHPIYICSHCGMSLDEEKIIENQNRQTNENNQIKQSLLRNLFPKQFMNKYTEFTSFSDFINECSLFKEQIEHLSQETMTKIPERKLNRYVKKHTSFSTWDQMFEKAVECYLKM